MNLLWGYSMTMAQTRVLVLCLIVALATGGILSGCGMKGPLYLPEEELEDKDQRADSHGPASMSSGLT